MTYHTPALLDECIEGLNIRPDGLYVDVTFGGGGHSRAILARLVTGRLIVMDMDADAMANAPDDARLIAVHGNFRFLRNYLAHYGYRQVNGILADLGVSSHHFDEPGRGFTFRRDAPLDMRMNIAGRRTAGYVLNRYPEDRIREIFAQYGELPDARLLARQIAMARQYAPIERSDRLIEIIGKCIPRGAENKYLAKVFQALRIETNGEIENLEALLTQSVDLLPEGGRLAVVAYHSLEDRLVKNYFKTGNVEGNVEKDFYGNLIAPLQPVNNKVITASEAELKENSRARSAKLRIAEKK
jgi:16S rRNA (cytosine1402-N4)-methyltransferase